MTEPLRINASIETIEAVTQVLKMAAILDDRVSQGDPARLGAWAEQVERHKLNESDLLDGLQAYYDAPSDRAIGIGDLIHHARQARRQRTQAEGLDGLERRQAELDATKPAPEPVVALPGFVGGQVTNRTPRFEAAEQALQECHGREECRAALVEYFAAKREALGMGKAHNRNRNRNRQENRS
ncbi:hypothetical protein SEA_VENTI_61 [Mycobacterium phage Venti]|uniref:DnaC-like helicase loader n=1 Tax=Mycobacterium phage Bartholomew TaxID=2015875 RepID=A0A222ZNV0_9CAUD|nr:hypothetical protein I5J45_gp59 [Mycobacterium phage Bartholomew]ASR86434.1 hypothetical protein SEA_BARTHOLOMEW_59 [Mycobacterium phage Bartholomew]UVK59458.1 hypothetical protein SEA_VENTI_61 [Mycobacterium phage Venti]